jgi:ferredoxin
MARTVRIRVDHDKCVGSRICVAISPKVFELDANGQAAVADPDADTLEMIRMAAEGCPVSAITVEAAQEE